jgi:hypothetical protein
MKTTVTSAKFVTELAGRGLTLATDAPWPAACQQAETIASHHTANSLSDTRLSAQWSGKFAMPVF